MGLNEREKKDACIKAMNLFPEKGTIGIGSGSTMCLLASIINKNSKNKFVPIVGKCEKELRKRKLKVVKNKKADVAFDGADCFIKQKGRTIALKGAGGLDFVNEKKQDYFAKKLYLVVGESKLKKKICPVFIEVKKGFEEKVKNKLKEKEISIIKIPKTNPKAKGKKNSFFYINFNKNTDFFKMEKMLDNIEGILGNGIFARKKFEIVIGKSSVKKSELQVALDFNDEKKAMETARKVKSKVDIIEIGTPLVKASNTEKIIKKMNKFNTEIFADLKTMDAGYFETSHAVKNGSDYVSVLGRAANSTIKGALKNGKNKVVVDLICCENVVKRIKELKKIGVKNFEIHTGIDEQVEGKKPLNQLEQVSKISEIRVWVAGGIDLEMLDSIMVYHPEVVVIGGAITKAKNVKEISKDIKNRIEELSVV